MTWEVVVQSGHLINVRDVSFSPDGRSLVTCGSDESIKLWDIGLGCQSGELQGHLSEVIGIAHSGDGRRLASASHDNTVRIWDIAARRCVRTLRGQQLQPLATLAFARDGSKAAARSLGLVDGGMIFVWDVETGSTVAAIPVTKEPEPLALTPDGRWLAFAEQGQIRLLDVAAGDQRVLLAGSAVALAFAPDGASLLVLRRALMRVDLGTGQVLSTRELNGTAGRLTVLGDGSVAVCTDQETLICGDPPRSIPVGCQAVSPDVRLLARIAGREVELVDPGTGSVALRLGGRLRIPEQPGNLTRQFVLASSPTEPLLAAAGPDGLVRMWDLARAPGPMILKGHERWIYALAFSADGRLLASSGADGVRVWNRQGGPPLLATDDMALELAFSAEGSALVIGSPRRREVGSESKVRALEVETGREIASVPAGAGRPDALAVSPYNQVAIGTGDHLMLWPPFLNGTPHQRDVPYCREFCFDRTGRLGMALGQTKAATGTVTPGRGAVYTLSPETLVLLQGHTAAVRTIAFSPDGVLVATGGEDGAVMVWDAATGERKIEIPTANAGNVTDVAWTSDGRFVASTGYDGMVRLWELPDGRLAATLLALDEDDYFAVTADGHYSATKGGLDAIVLRTDDGIFPFEQFDLQLNRPDLVLERLGFASAELIEAYRDAHRRRLARLAVPDPGEASTTALPVLKLSGEPPPVSDTGTADFAVELTSAAHPLSQLHVSVNDVPVYGRAGKAVAGGQASFDEQVTLTPGPNEIALWAVDAAGANSIRRGLRVFDSRPEQPRRLLVVAIGVSDYQAERFRLEYAAKDAHDLAAELSSRGGRFAGVEARVLENATRDQVLGARDFLLTSNPVDHVLLLLAGHGVLLGADFAFLPADTIADDLAARAIRYEDIEGLIDGIPARRRLVLLDTCHSGEEEGLGAATDSAPLPAGIARGRSFRDISPESRTSSDGIPARPPTLVSLRDTFADLRQESGAFVIAAAGAAEYALELDDLQNGVFTASVIQTLRADDSPTVTRLADEVSRRVLTLTGGRQQPMIRRENLADDYHVI